MDVDDVGFVLAFVVVVVVVAVDADVPFVDDVDVADGCWSCF